MSGESWPTLAQRRLLDHIIPPPPRALLLAQSQTYRFRTPNATPSPIKNISASRAFEPPKAERLELSLYDKLCV